MEEKSSVSSFTTEVNGRKKNSHVRVIFIIIFLILLLIVIFSIVKLLSLRKEATTPSSALITPTIMVLPTDTPIPTLAPVASTSGTPTLTPALNKTSSIDKSTGLDRSKLTITIQNGNGAAGVGKKASDMLEALGYVIQGTENADNFTYDKTVIKIKAGKNTYLSLLQKDLAGSYTIGSTSATLDNTLSEDAIIIIGKQ